jgi:hypothetical protein
LPIRARRRLCATADGGRDLLLADCVAAQKSALRKLAGI